MILTNRQSNPAGKLNQRPVKNPWDDPGLFKFVSFGIYKVAIRKA